MTNNLMKKTVKEQEIKYLWAIYTVKAFALEKLGKRKEAISTINKFNPEILELFLSKDKEISGEKILSMAKGTRCGDLYILKGILSQ